MPHPSSFRDPDAWVESVENDLVVRRYSVSGASDLEKFMESAAWGQLVNEGIIEPPVKADLSSDRPFTEHRPVATWNYPYEWSQSMLLDAALTHLRVVEVAAESGWTTKDASSFNIVLDKGAFRFVDLGSFTPIAGNDPWWAYQEFCEHFLYPLMVSNYLGVNHGQISLAKGGKLPLEDAAKILGHYPHKAGVAKHVLLPARIQKSDESISDSRSKMPDLGCNFHLPLVKSLRKLLNKLAKPVAESAWGDYSQRGHYRPSETSLKSDLISEMVEQIAPNTILDMGGNDGLFSSALASVESVVVVDAAEDAIDQLYRSNLNKKLLPMVLDLVNPTPAIGWANKERSSFTDRVKPDLILMLALIHHIAISNNVPHANLAAWMARFQCPTVIEFVDRSDEKVQHLLARKVEDFPYSKPDFLKVFSEYFDMKFISSISPTRDLWLANPI